MADLGAIGDRISQLYAHPALGFSGTVLSDAGAGVSRTVRAYDRSSGALVREIASHPTTGAWAFATTVQYEQNQHQIVFLDDDAGTQYNDIIYSRVMPG